MTKTLIRNYIQNLRNTRDSKIGKVPPDIQTKINKVVDLFEDRKISQYGTANKLINDISINDAKKRKSGLKRYEKAVAKYEEAEPITERMAKTAKKARTGKEIKAVAKTHDKQPILKRKALAGLATKAKEMFKNRKFYNVKFMLFSLENRSGVKRPAFTMDGRAYYPLIINTRGEKKERTVATAHVKANQFLETVVQRKIRRHHQDDKGLYKRVMLIMNTSSEFQELGTVIDYADAIRIESIELVEADTSNYDEREEHLRESENMSIYYKYVQTEVDADAETVKEALAKKDYRDNECWINALLENYEGTHLTKEKKSHKQARTLSRDKVLELLELSEEDFINNGASVNQMDTVFKYFKIPVRLYNFMGVLIYEHNPEGYEIGKVRMFRGLVKNNHVYLLNDNLKKLCQTCPAEKSPHVSSRFYITDKKEATQYEMFDNIDELLKLNAKEEYNLIHAENDLVKVAYQLREAKYQPLIKYQGGEISNIMVKFYFKQLKKSVKYNISSQNLSKHRVDENVATNDVETYNKIVDALFQFQKGVFKEQHLSYYNEVDMAVLKECKTIVPIGVIQKIPEQYLREIDIRKAFTHAGTCIKNIPRFTEFDIWKPFTQDCSIHEMHNLTMYIVEIYEGNICFNKKYNLRYGMFLKRLIKDGVKMKILYYKQPSYIHKVDYKQLVDDLYATDITDHKVVANYMFGMLEKSHNTAQQSSVFNSLREACYYQSIHGGKIYTVGENKVELFEEMEDEQLIIRDVETKGTVFYVLNVSEKRELTNGFIYIQELLLQYHNQRMYEAYKALDENNIPVCSVKTDAFTIPKHHLDKACEILDFRNEIGNWRVEDKEYIRLPTDPYKYKFNEVPEIPKI